MDQNQQPLVDVLQRHSASGAISFHVPGHKQGVVRGSLSIEWEALLAYDATEITGLDDLHAPSGPILKSQQLLSSYYHSLESYFLVGGSTSGNLAMILATCQTDDVVLVQRNAHQSIFHALELAGARPVLLAPTMDKSTGKPVGIAVETLLEATNAYPQAKTLILTTPNYYGMVSAAMDELIQQAKARSLTVLVDEAHGVHFALGAPFPTSALAYGADVVVQSTHKMLPSLTMGAYLHVHERSHISRGHMGRFLRKVQTSSPSYLIMASLDAARHFLATLSAHDVDRICKSVTRFKRELSTIPGLTLGCPDERIIMDPLKLLLSVEGVPGTSFQSALEKEGIFPELVDDEDVLFIFGLAPITPMEQTDWRGAIQRAVNSVRGLQRLSGGNKSLQVPIPNVSAFSMSYHALRAYKETSVPVTAAEGWIAAESVVPYPPGIPLIARGERITTAHLEKLQQLIDLHAHFQGNHDVKDVGLLVFTKD
ncbi:aminotransferase class I/II-fold pyridoxal phosphate-dependent enzyme [Aureibacillus halotolerans]|nr:aminotransferase class I/II-fold pyridoxal phosphate-dependent enzyme [Aureibacillus halotolerans]